MPAVKIIQDKCKGCELCVTACPQQILALSKDINSQGYRYAHMSDPHRCIGCALCAVSCPDIAIEVYVEGTMYRFYGSESDDLLKKDEV